METNLAAEYTILGADGNQYGPVTLEQIRAWVQEGRVTAITQIWRNDLPAWSMASALPELGLAAPMAAPIHVATPAQAQARMAAPGSTYAPALNARVRGGSGWLYAVAVLSVINSIAALSGSSWRFLVGLGVTQVIDGAADSFGTSGKVVAFALDALIAGVLFAFGMLGRKGHGWALLAGAILVALDGVLLGLAGFDLGGRFLWLSLAFHVWAVVRMFLGFQALRAMKS